MNIKQLFCGHRWELEKVDVINTEIELTKLFGLFAFRDYLETHAAHLRCTKCNKTKIDIYKLYAFPDKEDNND